MSDWDAPEDEAAPASKTFAPAAKAPIKKKWADEDESSDEDVASDWEASEEEKPAPKAVPQPAALPKKKPLKQRLAEKAAAEEARRANGEVDSDTEDDLLDPAIKKRLERERELEADMKNASDLLQGTSIASSSSNKDLDAILKANPKTKEDFTLLSNQIIDVVIKRLQNKPLYAQFVEHHIRELARPLKDLEVRKSATVLTTLANEKQKEQREGGKKKKTTKPTLGQARPGHADTRVYDEALDDFGRDPDDFM